MLHTFVPTRKLSPLSPVSGCSRACEKIVLQPRGQDDGAKNICDIVRFLFVCKTLNDMATLLNQIRDSPDIEVVRFKDRIKNPSGGWRDAMINFCVRKSDCPQHICEVQIVHEKMALCRRKDGLGGHDEYAKERNARELLEYLCEQADIEAEAARVHQHCEGEAAANKCSFWFVSAKQLRDGTEETLPHFQELQKGKAKEGYLQRKEITCQDSFTGVYTKEYLAVSHRWFDQSAPDKDGVQLKEIRKYLRAHLDIQWVWYGALLLPPVLQAKSLTRHVRFADFWCMPQFERSPAETEEFRHMLSNINLLYLGCSVLVLLDLSYLSRFWVRSAESNKESRTPNIASNPSFSRLLTCLVGHRRSLRHGHRCRRQRRAASKAAHRWRIKATGAQ